MIALLLVAVLAALATPGAAQAGPRARKLDHVLSATRLVEALACGEYDRATSHFGRTMKRALSADQLREVWTRTTEAAGKVERLTGVRTERATSYVAVYVRTRLSHDTFDVKVVYDRKGQIVGLWFVPTDEPGRYRALDGAPRCETRPGG